MRPGRSFENSNTLPDRSVVSSSIAAKSGVIGRSFPRPLLSVPGGILNIGRSSVRSIEITSERSHDNEIASPNRKPLSQSPVRLRCQSCALASPTMPGVAAMIDPNSVSVSGRPCIPPADCRRRGIRGIRGQNGSIPASTAQLIDALMAASRLRIVSSDRRRSSALISPTNSVSISLVTSRNVAG